MGPRIGGMGSRIGGIGDHRRQGTKPDVCALVFRFRVFQIDLVGCRARNTKSIVGAVSAIIFGTRRHIRALHPAAVCDGRKQHAAFTGKHFVYMFAARFRLLGLILERFVIGLNVKLV